MVRDMPRPALFIRSPSPFPRRRQPFETRLRNSPTATVYYSSCLSWWNCSLETESQNIPQHEAASDTRISGSSWRLVSMSCNTNFSPEVSTASGRRRASFGSPFVTRSPRRAPPSNNLTVTRPYRFFSFPGHLGSAAERFHFRNDTLMADRCAQSAQRSWGSILKKRKGAVSSFACTLQSPLSTLDGFPNLIRPQLRIGRPFTVPPLPLGFITVSPFFSQAYLHYFPDAATRTLCSTEIWTSASAHLLSSMIHFAGRGIIFNVSCIE